MALCPMEGERSLAPSGTQWELWQLHHTPWQRCHHSPSSLPASQTLLHGPRHGADAQGFFPMRGRCGMLPLSVHSHLTVDQDCCRLTLDGAGLGMGSAQASPSGLVWSCTFLQVQVSAPGSMGSLFQFHLLSLVSPARFPRLLSVGSIPCAHLRELSSTPRMEFPWAWLARHGSPGSVLQAHLARGVSCAGCLGGASWGSPHQPGASRGPPLPAQHRLEIIKRIISLAKLCARIRKRAGIRSPPGDRRQRVPPGFCFQCQHSAALKPWERSSLKWQLWSQAINLTS